LKNSTPQFKCTRKSKEKKNRQGRVESRRDVRKDPKKAMGKDSKLRARETKKMGGGERQT
jgi:hypothetical protein